MGEGDAVEGESFATPQKPNLDPEVEKYGEALREKVDRVRELLAGNLDGVELKVCAGAVPLLPLGTCCRAQVPTKTRTRALTHARTASLGL